MNAFKKILLASIVFTLTHSLAAENNQCKKAPDSKSPQVFWDYFREEALKSKDNIKCLPVSNILIQKGELDGDRITKLKGDDRFRAISSIMEQDTGLGQTDLSTGTTQKLTQRDLITKTIKLTERNNPNPDFIGVGNMTFRLTNKSWKLETIYK
jgi:hypothetical protein